MTEREKILKRYSHRLQNICIDFPSLNIARSASPKAPSSLSNHQKRICHARLELLRLDILEDTLSTSKSSKPKLSSADYEKFSSEIDLLDSSLNLSFVQSKFSLLYQLHDLLRLVVVFFALFTAGMIVSLPMLFLRVTDGLFASIGFPRPYKPACIATKAFIGNTILLTSGVVLKVQGLTSQTFSSKRTLACFTHGSTIDAFVLGATLPIPATVLAKKELFLLPYFGWLMQAYGNVPIDRKNINSAVVSLEIATELADSVLIAPEGTRSTTGQLLPFKKGPFHLWHSLHGPIVPIVITGAYELLPPGTSLPPLPVLPSCLPSLT
jgi:1-acyl-sn-glycerol-3-phosphate acyltransferase